MRLSEFRNRLLRVLNERNLKFHFTVLNEKLIFQKMKKISKQRKLFLIFLKPYAILDIMGILYANRKAGL